MTRWCQRVQVADCTIQLAGTQRTGTITLCMSRVPSPQASVLMYHLAGPGEWRCAHASVPVPMKNDVPAFMRLRCRGPVHMEMV